MIGVEIASACDDENVTTLKHIFHLIILFDRRQLFSKLFIIHNINFKSLQHSVFGNYASSLWLFFISSALNLRATTVYSSNLFVSMFIC